MRLKRILLSTLLVLLLTGGVALAQGGDYALSRWTVVPSGASGGGSYHLVSAIGQPEAGPLMSGGAFTLSGGFTGGSGGESSAGGDRFIYLPLVIK